MAELGDLLQEWHKAKPPEKLLIVGISVAALGIAIYVHSHMATSSPTPTNPVGGAAGNPGTIQTGGTPSNGQPVPPGTPTPPPVPPTKTPTGKTPPTYTSHPIVKAPVVRGGTAVTHVMAKSHPPQPVARVSPPDPHAPTAQQWNTRYRDQNGPTYYHRPTPPTAQQWNTRYRDQNGPTSAPAYKPINPTQQQTLVHLQNMRRMPA